MHRPALDGKNLPHVAFTLSSLEPKLPLEDPLDKFIHLSCRLSMGIDRTTHPYSLLPTIIWAFGLFASLNQFTSNDLISLYLRPYEGIVIWNYNAHKLEEIQEMVGDKHTVRVSRT